MSERTLQILKVDHWLAILLATVIVTLGLVRSAQPAGGPVDALNSTEPRVEVAKCLSTPGLVSSPGTFQPFVRLTKGDTIHSRDLLVALPGFKVDLEPAPRTVTLTLWGNLPGLSDSPVLESSVTLHDTKAFDLDFTLVRGRVVLTNNKTKGAAKVWLRGETGVQLVLPSPGDAVAIESYGRWPAGVPFIARRQSGEGPVRLWEVHCLKGKLEIKAGKTEWFMAEPPGLAYFHGDSVDGPASSGPEKRGAVPEWWDRKTKMPKLAKLIEEVVEKYTAKFTSRDPEEVAAELLTIAEKEKDAVRARVKRYLVVHALAAIDDVEKVCEFLEKSTHDEMRKAAVVALRHWIGAREGRDEKLYEIIQNELSFSKAEAETVMQLLHSPFDPRQPETFDTLIAYLKHRKQAVRELAHWHLVRLASIGRDIPYDAAGSAAERDKAAAQWRKLIPAGELPKAKKDETKTTSEK
jgi:hypothetical protein